MNVHMVAMTLISVAGITATVAMDVPIAAGWYAVL